MDYKNIYLSLCLPDYIDGISELDGKVFITSITTQQKYTLHISLGDARLNIKSVDNVALEAFTIADSKDYDKSMEFYQVKQNVLGEISEEERLWYAMLNNIGITASSSVDISSDSAGVSGTLFEIQQRLGKVLGGYQIACSLCYWPKGKVDSETKESYFPYLLSYVYDSTTAK